MTRPVPQHDFRQRRSARRAPPPIERRTHIALADLLRIACRPWVVVVAISRAANTEARRPARCSSAWASSPACLTSCSSARPASTAGSS